MLTPNRSSNPSLHEKALARIADVLDAAAEKEGVSPDELRLAIQEAMRYADGKADDTTPEAFVLSVTKQLF